MRLTTRQTGIISYAGVEEKALWEAARRAFSHADTPARFRGFLPVFPAELIQNMSYVGVRSRLASPMGFSTDENEYHRRLSADWPDLYAGDNYRRNFDADGRYHGGAAVTVDATWTARFPQYRPFMGEKLRLYMIGGGHQAVVVPESVFPRGGALLAGFERSLGITMRCEHYCAFVRARLERGERYDPIRFEDEYLRIHGLGTVCIRQRELGRVQQDLTILHDVSGGKDDDDLLTACRADLVPQYAPFCRACDTFEESPVTRLTARLMQLRFSQSAPVGDLWLPYPQAAQYIDRRRMTLDVRALCEGFQIAPAYDPVTRGGRYPEYVRVVTVRDRELRPLIADTLNNPAYGSGMGPMGMLNKLVYVRDSREKLRRRQLAEEEHAIVTENSAVDADRYRRMCELATLQEWKGRLVDVLYRRESALKQMQAGTRAYESVQRMLGSRADALERRVRACAHQPPQLSGYDADIDYLRRMQRDREGIPEDEAEPMPFSPDALRESCIESGYAMRMSLRRFEAGALLLPAEGQEKPTAPRKKKKKKPTTHQQFEQLNMFGLPVPISTQDEEGGTH